MSDTRSAAVSPDRADFSDWIGRTLERTDTITPRMVREYRATFDPHLAAFDGAPAGIQWCLSPDALDASRLGRDGHPRTGLVLPALPYPRRMWAGGELVFHGGLAEGDTVTRTSTIESITFKEGGSGRLGFVAVRHRYSVAGVLLIDERQDIVYREDPKTEGVDGPTKAPAKPAPAVPDTRDVALGWNVVSDPVLLFRYSALTFNGHRIHYDHPYATQVEGYAGLVVHGPMQAALMLNVVSAVLGRLPVRFSYRGLAPLICGIPFRVEALRAPDSALSARVTAGGVTTMSATIDP